MEFVLGMITGIVGIFFVIALLSINKDEKDEDE
jgi:hypothetical protein